VVMLPDGFTLAPQDRWTDEIKEETEGVFFSQYSDDQPKKKFMSSATLVENKLATISSLKSSNDVDLVRSYLRDIGRVPLLSHEQEITLGRQVQEYMQVERAEIEIIELTDVKPSAEELAEKLNLSTSQIKRRLRAGQRAKERMVAANLRLVVSVAKKYTKRNMELLDLIQEGTIGLVRGVEKFDPARGYKFSTYAYWWIRQGITRAIAEKSRAIRLPIHITEMLNKLKKGQRELSQEMSRTPTISELAKYVELPEDDVKDLMCKAGQPVSLETKVGDGEDTVLLDLLAGGEDLPDEQIEMDCMRGDLHSLLHQLPDLQCRVLRMRYGMDGDEPMSLTGIGRVLGISRDRVRNLERDGLRGLRRLSENVEAYFVS
jgi:RNA polymerase nonessential primary-like sigma factor